MKAIATLCLGLALAGCTAMPENLYLSAPERMQRERERLRPAREAADDVKCRQFGFKAGTEAYGNCRLKLEQIRATEAAAAQTRQGAAEPAQGGKPSMSFLCKDAISRGDSGGTFVHC